jgi:hypothetical protein
LFYQDDWLFLVLCAFPTLLKHKVRNIENSLADWKVIVLISGNIEAVSGPAAQDRPGAHEWIVWEGVGKPQFRAAEAAGT